MNNTFDIKRFGMLFKKHTLEQSKTYALSAAVLFGILFLVLSFFSYVDGGHLQSSSQVMVFVFVISGAGCIFGSVVFADLGDRSKAIPSLMLPASHFEKYLVGLIYSYFIFLAVFIAAFFVAGSIVVYVGHHDIKEDQLINLFDTDSPQFKAYAVFTMFHAFIFWGAIYFKKLHFVKTAIVFFVFLGLLTLLNQFTLSAIFQREVSSGMPFDRVNVKEDDNYFTIFSSEGMLPYAKAVFVFVVLLFWTTTYFKLKEKEA